MSVMAAAPGLMASQECVTLLAPGGRRAGRCAVCPQLVPGTNYTLLAAGRNEYGDSVVVSATFVTLAA